MIRPMNPMLKSRGIMTKNYTFKCSAMMQPSSRLFLMLSAIIHD